MVQKLSFVVGVMVVLVLVISTSCFKSPSAEKVPIKSQHPNLVVDQRPIKPLTNKPVLVKNPGYPSKVPTNIYQSSSEEGDEFVDVETKLHLNGKMELNFTSHGRKHTLELKESKVLAEIPINLVGSSQKFTDEVNRRRKGIKIMKDVNRRAVVAVEKTDGQTELQIKKGVLRVGKHQYEISGDSLNRTKVTKQLVKDTPPRSRDSVRFQRTSRRKRAVPVEVTPISAVVELAMIIDYSIWSHMSSGDVTAFNQSDHMINLLLYYAHMADIMNEHYKTMKNDDVQISVVIAGIVVITTDSQLSTLTEDQRVSGDKVDSSDTLDGLAKWMGTTEASNTLPRNDHTMLFTRYDMYDKTDGDTGTIGLAYTGTICDSQYSVSLIEIGGVLSYDASTAAHELGHSLGAGHDEKDNGCDDNNYVMAAYSGSNSYLTNRFQFSCCSQRSFYATITNNDGCLMEGVADPDHDPSIDTNVETYLPGQIFSADDQCYMADGTKACGDCWRLQESRTHSSNCQLLSVIAIYTEVWEAWSIYTLESTSICLNLYCELASDSSLCSATLTAAADGTDCDVDKWCIQSQCVDKNQTYSLPDQNCDVTNCHTSESKCSNGVNIVTPDMFRCYSDNLDCDGVPDCSDGTDEKDCNKVFTCPSGYTKCHFGTSEWELPEGVPRYCIDNSWVCDGEEGDCTDNSDESDCLSSTTEDINEPTTEELTTKSTTKPTTAQPTTVKGGSTTTSFKAECYICQDTNICINKEEDCEKDCPDDKHCIDGVKSLYSGVVRVVQDYKCMAVLVLIFVYFS